MVFRNNWWNSEIENVDRIERKCNSSNGFKEKLEAKQFHRKRVIDKRYLILILNTLHFNKKASDQNIMCNGQTL